MSKSFIPVELKYYYLYYLHPTLDRPLARLMLDFKAYNIPKELLNDVLASCNEAFVRFKLKTILGHNPKSLLINNLRDIISPLNPYCSVSDRSEMFFDICNYYERKYKIPLHCRIFYFNETKLLLKYHF